MSRKCLEEENYLKIDHRFLGPAGIIVMKQNIKTINKL